MNGCYVLPWKLERYYWVNEDPSYCLFAHISTNSCKIELGKVYIWLKCLIEGDNRRFSGSLALGLVFIVVSIQSEGQKTTPAWNLLSPLQILMTATYWLSLRQWVTKPNSFFPPWDCPWTVNGKILFNTRATNNGLSLTHSWAGDEMKPSNMMGTC